MLTRSGDPIKCKYTDTEVLAALIKLSEDKRAVLNEKFNVNCLFEILNDGSRFKDVIVSMENAVKTYQLCIDGIFALRDELDKLEVGGCYAK